MTDSSRAVKQEGRSPTIPRRSSCRLPPAVLDLIFSHASVIGNAKTSTRTLLACALACRAMRRPAQAQLYRNILVTPEVERTAVLTRAFDSNSTLGSLVKSIEVRYQAAPYIFPLPVHVVGRLSNVQKAIFAALNKHQPFDTSFIRLFAAPCQSLKMMTLAFIGFPLLSDLIRLLWSFPSLESLMLQHCAWEHSPTDALPDPALHPGHVSKLTGLTLWLDYAARPPLSLAPFGTNLTKLDIDPLHSFASTVDYKGLAALDKLVIFTLRLTKGDIAVAPQALSHIRSSSLRWLGIAHRVEDQSPETTVRQLDALNPRLADVLERPTFWDLKGLRWAVISRVLPGAAGQERWKRAVTPFVQVMADRKLLSVVVEEGPKST